MKHYLLRTTTFFYDPHGTPDAGGTEFMITDSEDYPNIAMGVEYEEDHDEGGLKRWDEDEEDGHYAQDGYNCEVEVYQFKIIKEDDIPAIQETIENYSELNEGY